MAAEARAAAKARAADDSGAPESQAEASWEHLQAEQRSASTSNVDVYLEDFISVVHGVHGYRCQFLYRLFHQIYRFFQTNEELDTNRKDSISQNKLGQEDGAWSTRNNILGWYINTIAHLIRLPPRQQ